MACAYLYLRFEVWFSFFIQRPGLVYNLNVALFPVINCVSHGEVVIAYWVFIPGMYLENYVQPDFGNTTITVLAGKVLVELIEKKRNVTLVPEQSLQVCVQCCGNV